MPVKQSEEKTILGHIAYWAKFLATTGVGILMTWSLNRQSDDQKRQETIRENQSKFNSDVTRALDRHENEIETIREYGQENRGRIKDLEDETDDLERQNRLRRHE